MAWLLEQRRIVTPFALPGTGGDLETKQDFLKSRPPLFEADQIKVPLLIGQGTNDPHVKQAVSAARSALMVCACRCAGVPLA